MTDSQHWIIVFWIAVASILVYLLSPVLTPFLAAILLAYFFNPVVDRLAHWHIPRVLVVILIFAMIILALFCLIFLLIPVLGKQTNVLLGHIPVIEQWWWTSAWPWLNQHLPLAEKINIANTKKLLLQHLPESSHILARITTIITQSTGAVVLFIMNLILIPVLTFYFLWDWHAIMRNVSNLLPRHTEKNIIKMIHECGEVLAAFFRGQLMVVLCLSVIYALGLWLVGLPAGILIGLMAGLLSLVPYLGFASGLIVALISAVIQFHDIIHLMGVLMVFGIGEVSESWILVPWLVGDRIGIHPLAIIFALMAGGTLFGFVGILLAVPVTAVLMVLLRHVKDLYFKSRYYAK